VFTIKIVKRIQNSTVVLTTIGRKPYLGSHNRESHNREFIIIIIDKLYHENRESHNRES